MLEDNKAMPPMQPPSRVSHGEKVIQPISQDLKASSPTPVVPTPAAPAPATPAEPPKPVGGPAHMPNPDDIYPTATAYDRPDNPTVGLPTTPLVGSQLALEKPKMPIGIYIIAGLNLIGFVISFINTSQNSTAFTIAMFIDLLLAIGLLFRLEIARIILIVLSVLLIIGAVISLIGLVGLQNRINTLQSNYHKAVSQADQQQLTPQDQQALAADNVQIQLEQKQAGKAIDFSYLVEGMAFVEGVAVVIYLTRPGVKAVFHKLQK